MVLTQPAPLRSDADTQRQVHWTRFSAADVPVDWSDHHVAHKSVMRLFAPDLGDTARAHAGALFRLDPVGYDLAVLVQSTEAPLFVPPAARRITFTPETWSIGAGAAVRLRVAVNPISRTGSSERVRSTDESHAWLIDRLTGTPGRGSGAALADLDVVNVTRAVHTKRTGRAGSRSAGDKMTVDTFDAVAHVNDTAVLDQLRRGGLGRRKSYGCGLLTVQQIG